MQQDIALVNDILKLHFSNPTPPPGLSRSEQAPTSSSLPKQAGPDGMYTEISARPKTSLHTQTQHPPLFPLHVCYQADF